jgi:hypothetical protein
MSTQTIGLILMFKTAFRLNVLVIAVLVCSASLASATPISLNVALTGDPRPNNPDGLEVLVSILGDTTSSVTYWTVDLTMNAEHPNARLDEFGFNLLGLRTNYTFGNFNLPYTPVSGNLNGSGGTTFLLTLDDPNGNRYDATNLTSLSFTVTKTSNFTLNDFLLAPVSCSNDALLGCTQLGAHLQALAGGASGVATGNYAPPSASVPEPSAIAFVGAGILFAVAWQRRRRVTLLAKPIR